MVSFVLIVHTLRYSIFMPHACLHAHHKQQPATTSSSQNQIKHSCSACACYLAAYSHSLSTFFDSFYPYILRINVEDHCADSVAGHGCGVPCRYISHYTMCTFYFSLAAHCSVISLMIAFSSKVFMSVASKRRARDHSTDQQVVQVKKCSRQLFSQPSSSSDALCSDCTPSTSSQTCQCGAVCQCVGCQCGPTCPCRLSCRCLRCSGQRDCGCSVISRCAAHA